MTVANELLDAKQTFAKCDFGLDKRLIKAVSKLKYEYATLVQLHCIPLVLQGKDLVVRARTGSGKTAAYALPVLQKILIQKSNGSQSGPTAISRTTRAIQALILVPTKELVDQVRNQMSEFMHYCRDDISILALGVQSMNMQQALLRDIPDILITTPTRLVAHLQEGNISSELLKESLESLVIDEADLILSFGLKKALCGIFDCLPKSVQIICMSATLSPELLALKKSVFHNAAIVKLEEGALDGKLQQFYLSVTENEKDLVLYALIKLGILHGKILFFVNSIPAAYRLKLLFEQFMIKSAVLNAELPYNSRQHIIGEYNRGMFDFLIATDDSVEPDAEEMEVEDEQETDDESIDIVEEEDQVDEVVPSDAEESNSDTDTENEAENEGEAKEGDSTENAKKSKNQQKSSRRDALYGVSRGVDFRGVQFVINVDFPRSARSYIHRIGRTARGGSNGTALSILHDKDAEQAHVLAKLHALQNPVRTAANDLIRQPAPLAFDLKEIDCFRYRVEDVRRAVTRVSVREAQLADIKKEILNSEKLTTHFEINPRDLSVLQHDKTIGTARIQPHLARIPDYLVPIALQPTPAPLRRKTKHKQTRTTNGKRRTDNDPLHTFESGVELKNDDEKAELEDRITYGTYGIGKSTAGRQKWKESHRKGKFNSRSKAKRRKVF